MLQWTVLPSSVSAKTVKPLQSSVAGWSCTPYVDQSISPSKKDVERPDYDAMVASYERGELDAIISWDLDRLTRQPSQLEEWIERAEEHGLKLVTANGDADLSTDGGRMFARIKAAVARGEVERKGARLSRAQQQRAEQGRWCSTTRGTPPVTVASTKTMVKPRMNNPAAPATAHWRLVATVPPRRRSRPPRRPHWPDTTYTRVPGVRRTGGERYQTCSCCSQGADHQWPGGRGIGELLADRQLRHHINGHDAGASSASGRATSKMSSAVTSLRNTAAGRWLRSRTMVVGLTEVGTPPRAAAIRNGGS